MSAPTPANRSPADNAGPHPVRTEKDVIATEDIGLPSGIKGEELPDKTDDIKPEPGRIEGKH